MLSTFPTFQMNRRFWSRPAEKARRFYGGGGGVSTNGGWDARTQQTLGRADAAHSRTNNKVGNFSSCIVLFSSEEKSFALSCARFCLNSQTLIIFFFSALSCLADYFNQSHDIYDAPIIFAAPVSAPVAVVPG